MKFTIKDYFSKCNQIRSFLRISLHLLKKSLMENFIFYAVKIYQELGLESLTDWRWYRNLVFFQKIIKNLSPTYLATYLNNNTPPFIYNTRISYQNTFRNISCKNFKSAFYPYCISEWNKLDAEIKKSETLGKFKARIMRFIKVTKRSTFNVHDSIGVRLVTRLPLDLRQLNELKFRHSFSDIVSPICDCGSEIESSEHFLLQSNHLFKSLHNIKPPILNL